MNLFPEKTKIFVAIILFMGVLSACKTDQEISQDFEYDYIQLDSGKTFLYQFDSIAFDDNTQSIDTFHYFLKEQIGGKMLNSIGQEFIVIYRTVAHADTLVWEPRESAFAQLKTTSYERIDQNQRKIKLLFPVRSNMIWNGNLYNDLGKINFLLSGPFTQKSYQGYTFSNIIEVQEANQVNFIETFKEKSAYSKGIGLVYYELTKLSTQSNKTGGYAIKQVLIKHP